VQAVKLRPRTLAAAATALAAACIATFAARPASAHLMAPQHGTLRVLDGDVFAVLSVPVSALHGFDDDGDGALSLEELERHQDTLRGEIDRRVAITDGDVHARTVRVDLVLAPDHEAAQDRAGQVVALEHVAFDAPPRTLGVRTDLFGQGEAERRLAITASHGTARADAETAELTPGAPGHTFFARPAEVPTSASPTSSPIATPLAAQLTWFALPLLVAGAWALVRRSSGTLPSRG
jgi:hypothetical protein